MSLASGEGKRMGIFDSLIVAYLFLGSTGGGALAVLSLLEALNSPRLAARRWLLPAEFFARAWAACAIVLGLSVVCLLADLGRIDRAFFLFTASTPSAIAVGAWSLAVACALSTVFACANMLEMWDLREKLAVPGGVFGVLIGVVVMAYTGILLAGLPSVVAWQTPLVPALFVLSGISCGVALCLGAWAFAECRAPLMGSFIALSRVDSAAVAVEAACLVAYVAWLFASPTTSQAAFALVAGDLRWPFWIGLVVCGLGIPLVLEHLLTFDNGRSQLLWVALFVLIGGVTLRYSIVGISAFDITQTANLADTLALP